MKTMIRLPLNPQPVSLGLNGGDLRREMFSWKKLICALNFYPDRSIILDALPYRKDDFLWAKESFRPVAFCMEYTGCRFSFRRQIKIEYRADGEKAEVDFGESLNTKYAEYAIHPPKQRWIPSAKMERPAARIFLRIKNVRVERVNQITPSDCYDEGIRIEPPGALYPKRPCHWDTLSEGGKLNYAQSAARESYIAKIEYQQALMDELKKRWDARYGKRKGISFADNPWVQVNELSRVQCAQQ